MSAPARTPLPDEAVEVLRGLYRESRDPSRSAQLNWYLYGLRLKGFPLSSCAEVLGITREGIRHRVLKAYQVPGVPEAPSPPLPPPPPPPPPSPPSLNPGEVEQLRELQAKAVQLRGRMPSDHPYRQASEQLSELLYVHHQRGVPYATLEKALGVNTGTARARLARHGYKHRAPSQKPYKGAA